MERIGFVEAEGGPLILVDAVLARSWTGIDGTDYQRACDFFDQNLDVNVGIIAVGSGSAALWEIHGAGTADVYRSGAKGIMIVRAWTPPFAEASERIALAEEPGGEILDFGEIEVISGAAVVLWAAESGLGIDVALSPQVRRPRSLNLDNAGLIIPLISGKYKVSHDCVKKAGGEARRLHLIHA